MRRVAAEDAGISSSDGAPQTAGRRSPAFERLPTPDAAGQMRVVAVSACNLETRYPYSGLGSKKIRRTESKEGAGRNDPPLTSRWTRFVNRQCFRPPDQPSISLGISATCCPRCAFEGRRRLTSRSTAHVPKVFPSVPAICMAVNGKSRIALTPNRLPARIEARAAQRDQFQ
jgi:hypothetical protein